MSGIRGSPDYSHMDINALLDVDLVAVEAEDHLSVLLELTAPGRDSGAQRPPSTLQVVLDRSGSMSGERLDAAKDALESLIARLDPTDNFGLVTFDDEVAVPIPAGPLADKQAVRQAIRSVWPGGMTNLSGGYLRGIQEARRVAGDRGFTLLVLSDGHANVGVTDHAGLEQIASGAHHHGGTTSTIGIGLDYDEQLMAAIARGGAGNTHFAEQADEAGAALTTEVDDLLEQVIQAASLTIRPGSDATAIHLVNDLPATAVQGAVMVELGDFYAGEERRLMLALDVPAMSGLGLTQICELELQYVEAATLTTETVTVPVHVNVVPGDQAAGRVPNPTVRSELAFQTAQKAKREGTEAASAGDSEAASRIYNAAARNLQAFIPSADPEMAAELSEEQKLLDELSLRVLEDEVRTAKQAAADQHRKMRKRGRRWEEDGDG